MFAKIQDRLQSAVDARSTAQVEARLKTQMDDYLHTANTKLGVFRDVIDAVCGLVRPLRCAMWCLVCDLRPHSYSYGWLCMTCVWHTQQLSCILLFISSHPHVSFLDPYSWRSHPTTLLRPTRLRSA